MNDFLLEHEAAIRLTFFLGILGVMAFWEHLAPRRPLCGHPRNQQPFSGPQASNLTLVARLAFYRENG
ncbi:MAG: hypothetical protein HY882_07955 [Deltaproteobacteria bacterium]|nr:hypothetical protein [Deltaproteobacteria bacterium]